MKLLEVRGAVRPIYESLGVKRLTKLYVLLQCDDDKFESHSMLRDTDNHPTSEE